MRLDKKEQFTDILEKSIFVVCVAFLTFIHAGLWVYDQNLQLNYWELFDLYTKVLVIGAVILLIIRRKVNLTKSEFRSFALVVLCLCTYLLNPDNQAWQSSFYNRFFIPLILIMLIIGLSKNRANIWMAFTDFVCVVSVISLFFYVCGTWLHLVEPMTYIKREWGMWDPIPIANYYYLYYEAQVSHLARFDLWRNCGMFAEATMFSSLLCTALGAECFLYKRENNRRLVILLLVITIITTFSATGFVYLLICGVFYILNQEKIRGVLRTHKKIIIPVVLVFVGGLVGVIATKLLTASGSGSASVRLDHTITCFKLLAKKPIFGYGWEQPYAFLDTAKFSQGTSVGIPYYLYTGGLVLGLLLFVPYIYSFVMGIRTRRFNLCIFNTLFLFVFFFTAISSYPLVQLFIANNVMYSYDNKQIIERKNQNSVKSIIVVSFAILACALTFVGVAGPLKQKYSVRKISDIDEIVPIEEPYISDVNEIYLNSDFRSDSWFFIRGWFIEQGVDSSESELSIVLVDQNTGDSYRLPTSMVIRTDVTNAYGNGTNLDESGFMAYLLLDDLFADEYYYYDLYFEVQSDGQVTYFDPHISLDRFYEEE